MEAESESSESESDHPKAAIEEDLINDYLMDDNDDDPQLDPNPINERADYLMDDTGNGDFSQLDPNPINEREVAPSPPTSPTRVTIEDVVEDEGYRWIETYPEPAGSTHGQNLSKFESLRNEQITEGSAPWHPFESEEEWELGRWLMTSGISQKKIDSFLKLHKVSTSPHLKQFITYMSQDTRRCQSFVSQQPRTSKEN
jgi:hypothetical protein